MKRLKLRGLRQLLLKGTFPAERSSSAAELLYLVQMVQRTNARLVAEIGFNVGYSSYAMLAASPDLTVVSFDLGNHGSTRAAKQLIDKNFPGRHTLICGDSRETVPEYAKRHPGLRFDLVFIDGGHDYEVAKADLLNMKSLSSEHTAVVMDDVVPWLRYGKGPARAWAEAIEGGVVSQEEIFKDGRPVDLLQPPGVRAWALGRYVG
ncbi:hypothetical protein A5736_13305 [Mycobacterium sp. SP-6446]|nr:hypothetical protein A5736_13305 [Mycobacterium sp. SP-6446]